MISRSECLKCGKEPGDSDPARADQQPAAEERALPGLRVTKEV
jgi:hypothetical protein